MRTRQFPLAAAGGLCLGALTLAAEPTAQPTVQPLIAQPPPLSQATPDPAPPEDSAPLGQFNLYWDNDAPFFKPNGTTDRQYTNGTAISWSAQEPEMAWATQWLPHAQVDDRYGYSLEFGHLIYTPDDIAIAAPQPNDRPWAAYLFLAGYADRQSTLKPELARLDRVKIEIGLVGPSAQGEEIQKWVHRYTDSPDPEGWANQLNDEVTFNVGYTRKWRKDLLKGPSQLQVIPEWGFDLGTLRRQLSLGSTIRLGCHLPDDFGLPRIDDPAVGTAVPRSAASFGYLFLRGNVYLIEHDLFLEGNTYTDSASVQEEPIVGQVQIGLAWGTQLGQGRFDGGYSQTFESNRFRTQSSPHSYGSWLISLTVPF